MRFSQAAVAVAALGLAVTGCATKQYGRMQPLSAVEMSDYNCHDIAIELSKVDAFDEQIREQAGFDGRSALGILGDFGIGNSMAKGGAEKSSIERRRQLQMLSAQKGCAVAAARPIQQPEAPAAPISPQPAVTRQVQPASPRTDLGAHARCDTCRN